LEKGYMIPNTSSVQDQPIQPISKQHDSAKRLQASLHPLEADLDDDLGGRPAKRRYVGADDDTVRDGNGLQKDEDDDDGGLMDGLQRLRQQAFDLVDVSDVENQSEADEDDEEAVNQKSTGDASLGACSIRVPAT
jgi:hypothetical protein